MSNSIKRAPTKKQFGLFKAFVFLLCLVPFLRLFVLALQDDLSANPVEFVERATGFWTLFILLLTLSLTPFRLLTGIVWPIQLRRMTGLFMYFYSCLHITTYLCLDHSLFWPEISHDILKHPYVLVGFAAFLFTTSLAITSNNFMIRKLGRRWKQLHRLVYLIGILGVVHFWWLVKKDIRVPLLYGSILLALLAIRIYFSYIRRKRIG